MPAEVVATVMVLHALEGPERPGGHSHGVPFEPIAHHQTYTSIAEARTLGIEASEVLKTVGVQVAGGHALMVVTRQADEDDKEWLP